MQTLYRQIGVWRLDWNWVKEHEKGFKKRSKRLIRRQSKQLLKEKQYANR